VPSSPSSSSAQAARQHLADQLREIRVEARLTATALAAQAGWHGKSKVSKIEHGKRAPSADDIKTWGRVCSVPPDRVEELLAELRAVEGMWLDWRRMERAGLRTAQEAVRDIYESSTLVRDYHSDVMPGLLQTAGYTAAILEMARQRHGVAVDDVAEAVAERMDRQRIVRKAGHRFAFVLEEAVLRYRFGGTAVMREQLLKLLEAMRWPTVSLGIIPADVDRTVWPVEPFIVFDSVQVNVEMVSGFLTITQPREVAMYLADFTDLSALAVSGHDARALIRAALEALRSD
jgi:transcriptional regulator with XRE-family HTH domain